MFSQNFSILPHILSGCLIRAMKDKIKRNTDSKRDKIYFSCWSRKGFAVFAALGKNVCISVLAIHMYGCALLKAARLGIIVNEDACSQEEENVLAGEQVFKRCNLLFKGETCPDGKKNYTNTYKRGYDSECCISLF